MTPSLSYHHTATKRQMRRFVLLAATILIVICMALVRTVLPYRSAHTVAAAPTATLPYVAKVLGTQLAIYVEGEQLPALVTDIDVRTLPAADRALLRRGVSLPTDEALAKLLEDYGS